MDFSITHRHSKAHVETRVMFCAKGVVTKSDVAGEQLELADPLFYRVPVPGVEVGTY